jgi:hypothetical protein
MFSKPLLVVMRVPGFGRWPRAFPAAWPRQPVLRLLLAPPLRLGRPMPCLASGGMRLPLLGWMADRCKEAWGLPVLRAWSARLGGSDSMGPDPPGLVASAQKHRALLPAQAGRHASWPSPAAGGAAAVVRAGWVGWTQVGTAGWRASASLAARVGGAGAGVGVGVGAGAGVGVGVGAGVAVGAAWAGGDEVCGGGADDAVELVHLGRHERLAARILVGLIGHA